jgi:hypothetical protein
MNYAGRQPQRGRGGVPRLDGDRSGATGFQAPTPIELLFKPEERWYRPRRE